MIMGDDEENYYYEYVINIYVIKKIQIGILNIIQYQDQAPQ